MQLRRPNLPLTRVVPLTLPLTRLTHASHTHTHAHTHVHNPLSTNPMNRTPPFVPPPTSAAQSVAIIRRMAFPRPTVVSFPRPVLDLHIVLRAPNVTQHRRGAARMQLLAPTPQPPPYTFPRGRARARRFRTFELCGRTQKWTDDVLPSSHHVTMLQDGESVAWLCGCSHLDRVVLCVVADSEADIRAITRRVPCDDPMMF